MVWHMPRELHPRLVSQLTHGLTVCSSHLAVHRCVFELATFCRQHKEHLDERLTLLSLEWPHLASPFKRQDVSDAELTWLRNFRCRDRIPGLGNLHNEMNVPSKQAGIKYNWYIQVAEYYNYKYASICVDPFDVQTAFEALSGDV